MLYRVHLVWAGFELIALVVKRTDCIGSYKSNYHTITTTKTPWNRLNEPIDYNKYFITIWIEVKTFLCL